MEALFGVFLASIFLGYTDGNDFPSYYASIMIKVKSNYEHRCGATLISENVIVTSAYCFTGYNAKVRNKTRHVKLHCRPNDFLWSKSFLVLLNVSSDKPAEYKIDKYMIHPEVAENCRKNDVAVAQLEKPKVKGRSGKNLKPIIIDPLGPFCDCDFYALQRKDKNQSELLASNIDGRIINIILVPSLCREWYMCGMRVKRRGYRPPKNHVDDLGVFACFINSGSPLVCDNKLIGILLPGMDRCNTFLKVMDYKDWIKNSTEEFNAASKLLPAISSVYSYFLAPIYLLSFL